MSPAADVTVQRMRIINMYSCRAADSSTVKRCTVKQMVQNCQDGHEQH